MAVVSYKVTSKNQQVFVTKPQPFYKDKGEFGGNFWVKNSTSWEG